MPSRNNVKSASKRRSQNSSQAQNQPPSLESSQSTIPDLFNTTKSNSAADVTTPSSPNKRRKTVHSQESDTMAVTEALGPDRMYDFSGDKRGGKAVNGDAANPIAISDSPTSSPVKNGFNSPAKRLQLASRSGPRKLVVKNLKPASKFDPNQYLEDVWSKLVTALSATFSGKTLPYSMEELYKGVENVCRQGMAAKLYERLKRACELQLESETQRLSETVDQCREDVEVLQAVDRSMSTWVNQMNTIRSIFFYLDRSYLLRTPDHMPLDQFTVDQFRKYLLLKENIVDRAISGAYHLCSARRENSISDDDLELVRNAIRIFKALDLYVSHFEPTYLKQSLEHYSLWAARNMNSGGLAMYVARCQESITRETDQCVELGMEAQTRWTIKYCLEDSLIAEQLDYVLDEEEVTNLFTHHDLKALTELFSLLQRKSLGTKLKPVFEKFIVETGSSIIFDEAREQDMVIRLLDFKRKLDQIWEHSFQRREDLGHTLREAFETFINKTKRSTMTWGTDNSKPGEMIAKYVDTILKGGVKSIIAASTALGSESKAIDGDEDADNSDVDEDAELEKQLDNVLDLFRFVHGKAVFEAFYKRDLARRLLLARSASADAEKSMMSRLRNECGAGFTHNLEQMFKDMELAREEVVSYRQMLEERQVKAPVDLNVNVLSAAAWPSYPDFDIEIPQSVSKAVAEFESYYKMKHGGRRLVWKHSLAHCQIKADFPKGKKEIVVSAFQAMVLLLFNGKALGEVVSYPDIQSATNLDDKELKRTLQSLACAKYRVLTKSPKGKEVNASDTFTINANFSDAKYRIKINQVQAKETKEENVKVHNDVVADRNYECQAAIVRIMKSKKTITHVQLISETISATKSRGVLDPGDIKKNIEKLIDKEYMRRDEEDESGKTYEYLA